MRAWNRRLRRKQQRQPPTSHGGVGCLNRRGPTGSVGTQGSGLVVMMRVRVTVGGQRTTTDCVRLLDVCSPPPPLVHAREGHGVSSGFASRANGPPFPRRHGRWSRLVPAHHPPTPHRFFPGTTAQPQLGWGLSHRAPAALPTAHCSGTASGWTQVEWLSPGRHPGFFACCCRNSAVAMPARWVGGVRVTHGYVWDRRCGAHSAAGGHKSGLDMSESTRDHGGWPPGAGPTSRGVCCSSGRGGVRRQPPSH